MLHKKTIGEFRSVEKLLNILFCGEKEETISFKIESTDYLKSYHSEVKEIILTQRMISKNEKNVYVDFKTGTNEVNNNSLFCFSKSYDYPKTKRPNYSRAFKVDFLKEKIYVYNKEVFEIITNHMHYEEEINFLFPNLYFLSNNEKINEYLYRIENEINLDWKNEKWDFLRNKTKTKIRDFKRYSKSKEPFYQIKGTFCSKSSKDFFSISLIDKKQADKVIKEILDFNDILYRIFKESSVEEADFIKKYSVDISCGSIGFKNFHVSTIKKT